MAHLVNNGRSDTGQRKRATAGHQWRSPRQWANNMTAGFGLPEGIEHRAALAAHIFVVPHPGFGIDRLTHTAQQAQARQVGTRGMHRGIAFGRLDERTDGRGCGIEDGALVALDHLPETPCIGERGHPLENNLCAAGSQGAISDVGMPSDPADIGGAPEHVVIAQIKHPIHRHLGPQQVTRCAVLHPLGFAGGATGVQDKQRMLCPDGNGRAVRALARNRLVKGFVAPRDHVARGGGALVYEHVAHSVAVTAGQCLVDDGLERQLFAAAHLVVGGNHGHSTHINDAFVHRLGAEAAKHNAVRGANTGAGLHGDHPLDRHRHVNQHAVALEHTVRLQGVCELTHPRQKLLVGDASHRAVVGLKDDGGFMLGGRAHVAIQAIGRGIELTIVKPLIKRRVGFVQSSCEGLGPLQIALRMMRPKTFGILVSLGTQLFVRCHTRYTRAVSDCITRRKNPVFNQHGLNSGCRFTHNFVSCIDGNWPVLSDPALTGH